MKTGTKERIYWVTHVYPEEVQSYLDLGWIVARQQEERHPFIDGCIMQWNSEETPPVLK